MPKSLLHYGQTVGLAEYISISLTAAKGLNGAGLTVGHALSVFHSPPLVTRQAVVLVGAAARHAVGVTLLAVVGVFIAVRTIGTRGDAAPVWGGTGTVTVFSSDQYCM